MPTKEQVASVVGQMREVLGPDAADCDLRLAAIQGSCVLDRALDA